MTRPATSAAALMVRDWPKPRKPRALLRWDPVQADLRAAWKALRDPLRRARIAQALDDATRSGRITAEDWRRFDEWRRSQEVKLHDA